MRDLICSQPKETSDGFGALVKVNIVNNSVFKIFGKLPASPRVRKWGEFKDAVEETKRLIHRPSALEPIIVLIVAVNVTFWDPPAEKIFWLRCHMRSWGKRLSDYIHSEISGSMHDKGMNHYLEDGRTLKYSTDLWSYSALNKKWRIYFCSNLTIVSY